MKYKIRDKVRVREDLEVNKAYGEEVFVSQMTPLKGKEVTISYIDSYGYYRIKEDSKGLRWTDEMLLPVTKYKIGDKVIVREDLEIGKLYGDYSINKDMFSLRGKTVTICDIEYGFIDLKKIHIDGAGPMKCFLEKYLKILVLKSLFHKIGFLKKKVLPI